MKNVRIKVRRFVVGLYDYGIYDGEERLMDNMCRKDGDHYTSWIQKPAAIRNAKAMASIIGIKYDPEIIKQHGC